jgi:hypothetical protein
MEMVNFMVNAFSKVNASEEKMWERFVCYSEILSSWPQITNLPNFDQWSHMSRLVQGKRIEKKLYPPVDGKPPSFRDTGTDKSPLGKLATALERHLVAQSTPNPAPNPALRTPPPPPVTASTATTHSTLPPQSETTLEYKFLRFQDGNTTDAESSRSVLGNGFHTLKEVVAEAKSKDKTSRKKVFFFEPQKICNCTSGKAVMLFELLNGPHRGLQFEITELSNAKTAGLFGTNHVCLEIKISIEAIGSGEEYDFEI